MSKKLKKCSEIRESLVKKGLPPYVLDRFRECLPARIYIRQKSEKTTEYQQLGYKGIRRKQLFKSIRSICFGCKNIILDKEFLDKYPTPTAESTFKTSKNIFVR